jgi:hypothetical protein
MGKSAHYYESKIRIIILLFTLGMLYSCAAVERTVQNNVFYSSSPKMSIAVSKDFNYLGSGSYKYNINWLPSENPVPIPSSEADVDFYVFIPKDIKDQTIRKGIMVLIHKMPMLVRASWATPLYKNEHDQNRDYSLKLLGNEYYESVTSVAKIKGGGVFGWLSQKSFSIPACRISKGFIKREDDVQIKKEIIYFEDVTLSGFGCDKWEKMKELSDKQLKFVKEFDERASKAFQINSISKD